MDRQRRDGDRVCCLHLGALVDAVGSLHRDQVIPLVALLAVVTVGAAVLSALAQRAIVALAARITAVLREQIVDRVLTLDPTVVHGAGSGDVTSRVTEDMEIFSEAAPLLAEVFAAAVTVAVARVGSSSLDWRLAAPSPSSSRSTR